MLLMASMIVIISKSIINDEKYEPQYTTGKLQSIHLKKKELKWLTGVGPMLVSHNSLDTICFRLWLTGVGPMTVSHTDVTAVAMQ